MLSLPKILTLLLGLGVRVFTATHPRPRWTSGGSKGGGDLLARHGSYEVDVAEGLYFVTVAKSAMPYRHHTSSHSTLSMTTMSDVVSHKVTFERDGDEM